MSETLTAEQEQAVERLLTKLYADRFGIFTDRDSLRMALRPLVRDVVGKVERERDEAKERLTLLDQAAEWAEDAEFGPIRAFEQKLKGDPIMSALYSLSDMRRIVWEPVSDLLHVSNFEEVMPALRASEASAEELRRERDDARHIVKLLEQSVDNVIVQRNAAEASAQGLAERMRKIAATCMGGGVGNQSCREMYPVRDPKGLGEERWCYACQIRAALDEAQKVKPGKGGTEP